MKLFVVVTGDGPEGALWLAGAPQFCAVSSSVPVTVGPPGASRREVAGAVAGEMTEMRGKCAFSNTVESAEIFLG